MKRQCSFVSVDIPTGAPPGSTDQRATTFLATAAEGSVTLPAIKPNPAGRFKTDVQTSKTKTGSHIRTHIAHLFSSRQRWPQRAPTRANTPTLALDPVWATKYNRPTGYRRNTRRGVAVQVNSRWIHSKFTGKSCLASSVCGTNCS